MKHPKIVIPEDLGLSLAMMNNGNTQTLGVMGEQKAVMITAVQPDSYPAEHGIVAGDLILQVQDTPVSTPSEVKSGIEGGPSG